MTLSAESLFSFDRSELSASGREALDRFVRDMGGLAFDTVTVEGHTDRLGSDGYNQKLSQARAEAVKSYLAGPGGLAASRINTVGKGESSPVTRAGDCRGNAASAALIACLQPDRRVEIEVTGTR